MDGQTYKSNEEKVQVEILGSLETSKYNSNGVYVEWTEINVAGKKKEENTKRPIHTNVFWTWKCVTEQQKKNW